MQSQDCVEQIYPLVGDDGCVWEQRAHMDIVGVEIEECFHELPWNCPLSFVPKWFSHFVYVGHDNMLHIFHHGLLYRPVAQGMGDVPSRWKHEVRMTTWGFSFVNCLDWKKIARQRSTENHCNLAFISNSNHLNMLWTIFFHCPCWGGHDFNSSLFPV